MFSGGFGGFGGMPGFGGRQQQQQQQKKQVNTTEYYQLLDVDKKATTQQIRKAFRKKAIKQHPDKGGDAQKFKKITSAYQVLTNPQKRQLYDDYGQEGVKNGGPPGGSGFDIFDMFNRGGKKDTGPRKGKAKLINLDVTLKQIYEGCMRKQKIIRTRNCQTCDGKGGQNVKKCPHCKGRKVIEKLVQLGPGMYTQTSQKCPQCKATGEIMKEEDRCKVCKGQKIKEVQKQLEIAIQPGCPHEHDYIFTGQSDQYPNIIAGDVYARINIKKHKTFIRKGADLCIQKKITLLEALTGMTMVIDHLDGKKHTIATAPGQILSNKTFKVVKKLGLPFYKDPMSYGNLIIEFQVEFPKKNSITKQSVEKINSIFGVSKTNNSDRNKKKQKIIQDFHQADLNPNPQGGQQQQEQYNGGGNRQQVRCAQQ